MKKLYFLFLLLSGFYVSLCAQAPVTVFPDSVSIGSVVLPPLSVLFENARGTAVVEYYKYRSQQQESLLKSEKRSWMKYIMPAATYQYGVSSMSTAMSDQYMNVYMQNSNQNKNWYNAGVIVQIPLTEVVDRKNRIGRQRMAMNAAVMEMEMNYDQLKMSIIDAYSSVCQQLALFRLKSESFTMAKAQYSVGENDFINGRITAQELMVQKNLQVTAESDYETTRTELNKALLHLEILSKTEIISRKNK